MTEDESLAIIDRAVSEYGCKQVYAGFSGGHDSLVAGHTASKHPLFKGVVHVNTGIGVEETRHFVRETAKTLGWPLFEFFARKHSFQNYPRIIKKFGFPGKNEFGHRLMYTRLKERPLRVFANRVKTFRNERICLVTGAREEESTRRMGNMDVVAYQRGFVWANAIHRVKKCERERYISKNGLPCNPVVQKLCKSGECLCGAFAVKGELDELSFWYPKTAAYIRKLEKMVRKAGFPWG